MSHFNRRHFVIGLGAAIGAAAAPRIFAQSSWTAQRPIKLVVPYTAGGPSDIQLELAFPIAKTSFKSDLT